MKELFYTIVEELDWYKSKIELKMIKRKVEKMSPRQLNLYFNEIMIRKYNFDKTRLIAQIKGNLKYLKETIDNKLIK